MLQLKQNQSQGGKWEKGLASGVKRTSPSVKLSMHATEGMLGELNFR